MKGRMTEREETELRGYSRAEMERIQRRIEDRRRDWIHHFDSYIEHILYDDANRNTAEIINKARELADARAAVVEPLMKDLNLGNSDDSDY